MGRSNQPNRPPAPRGGTAFNRSIRVGDLILSTTPATKYYHYLRVREIAYEQDSRQGKKDDKYDWYYDYSDCYSGVALCGFDGSRTTWGNRVGYYWSSSQYVVAEMREDAICRKCRAALRRLRRRDAASIDACPPRNRPAAQSRDRVWPRLCRTSARWRIPRR